MEVKGEIFHENVYSLWNVMDAPKTNKATNTPFFKKLNRIHNLLKRKNIMKREQRTCLNGLHTTSYHSYIQIQNLRR